MTAPSSATRFPMANWTVTHVEDEEAWTADLMERIASSPVMPLPAKISSLGPVDVEWLDLGGECLVIARGGTIADRVLAHDLTRVALAHHGYRHLQIDP